MSDVRLLSVPYDSGHRAERQGLGPQRLIEHWFDCSDDTTRYPEVVSVETTTTFPTEIATAFELIRRLAQEVSRALGAGVFPLVLVGNCNTSALGGAAGLRLFDPEVEVGVLWFDGHADYNTPEIDPLGFLDGQGLAILTGRCWQALARLVPGFKPLGDASVILIGAHDLDDEERVALERSDITHITPSQIAKDGVETALADAVEKFTPRVTHVYVHVDLDVIDAAYARANSYASPGGLEPDQLFEAVRFLTDHLPVAAGGLTAYDPTLDDKGRIQSVATQTMELLTSS